MKACPFPVLVTSASVLLAIACAGPSPDESPTTTSAAARTLAVTFTDISAGKGPYSGKAPSPVIDEANRALLVVTLDGSHGYRPGLFRCSLEGAGCTYVDISAGQPERTGYSPVALLDARNRKLLVVTTDYSREGRLGLFRCDVDGASCAYSDISAGQGSRSGLSPSATIDVANQKLVVATRDDSRGGRPALYRCDLDGANCAYSDISAGQGERSGWMPSIVIDEAHQKVLVAARDSGETTTPDGTLTIKDLPVLFRCDLDGTSCEFRDISAKQGLGSGISPVAKIDATNSKLLVITQNYDVALAGDHFGILALFRCELDGTGCAFVDISAGQGADSAEGPSVVLDSATGELLVATWDVEHAAFPVHFGDPALYRCRVDGTGCTWTDLTRASPASPREFGYSPAARLITADGRLLVVAHTADERLGLLSIRR